LHDYFAGAMFQFGDMLPSVTFAFDGLLVTAVLLVIVAASAAAPSLPTLRAPVPRQRRDA
jgi:hypothetical protein